MKWNIILLIVGSIIGILAGLGLGYVAIDIINAKKQGAQFESLTELRQEMGKRDERDLQADRSVSLRSIMIPHPSDEIIFTLAPNLNVKFQRVPLNTNSFGMRGPETTIEKPVGTYRVALLGDSFAFGWGVEEPKIFARVLERELQKHFGPEKKVEVLNFGVPGYSTFQETALFLERGQQFQPDAVIIYFVDNDFGLPFFIRDLENQEKLTDVVGYVKRFWRTDSPVAAEQKKSFWRLLNPNRAIQKLNDELKKTNTPLFLAVNPNRRWKRDLKRLYVLRKRHGIYELRLHRSLTKLIEERNLASTKLSLPSDPHPNATKHQLLGEVLAAKMIEKLVKLESPEAS